jgi:hypothetical protein
MRVLFSNSPWWLGIENGFYRAGIRAGSRWPFSMSTRSRPDHFHAGEYLPYPMFMGAATTYAAKHCPGVDVRFRDSIAMRESEASYWEHLEAEKYDMIFLESATPSFQADSSIICGIAQVLPKCKIVVTGPITTVKAEEILARLPVVACCKGEYEKGSVRAINGETGVIDFDLLSVEEMNASPPPYLDSTVAHRYWDSNPVGQIYPHAQVWSGRGCTWRCIFCSFPANMTNNDPDGTGKRRVRFYTPEYMEAYLNEIVARYGFKSIYFDDDLMNFGDKHTLEMCAVMRKIGLPWTSMCRIDTVKRETWLEMKASGCRGVKVGFESGVQEVVDNIVGKRLDLKAAAETTAYLKQIGLTRHGTFMIGLPGETKEQMHQTLQFIEDLDLDSFQLSGAAVIDGTPLQSLEERGSLSTYKGAVIDDAYIREPDGQRKAERLALDLLK